jgi:hypothetical protein
MRLPAPRICLAALALAIATASRAEPTAAQREACTPDVLRLCSSQIPNVAGITACLRREKLRLSPGCRAVFSAAGQPRSAGL